MTKRAAVLEAATNHQRSASGVSIAAVADGHGPAIVRMLMAPWFSVDTQSRIDRRVSGEVFLSPAARMVVRYDPQGMGASGGEFPDMSPEAQVEDLAAVVNGLDQVQVALFAPVHAGPAAILFAARYPEKVSHLVLWCAYARGADFFGRSRVKAIRALLHEDWPLFTENLALNIVGWDEPLVARELATLIRESSDPSRTERVVQQLASVDVTSQLSGVRSPTLALRRRGVSAPPASTATSLAAGIPNARCEVFEGAAVEPSIGLVAPVNEAIENFLNESPRGPTVDVEALRLDLPLPSLGRVEPLTGRELEVLQLAAAGLSNSEIAGDLVVGVPTVKTHLHNTFGKLGARRRTEAVAKARKLDLID